MSDPFAFPAELFQDSAAARRPAVGISACLQGQPVRYDGTDKRLPQLALLAEALALEPLCPEVEAGLGLPRPPVQLVRQGDGTLRVLGRDHPALDVTAALTVQAERAAARLAARRPPLCGWVWKARSPSCGLGSTPLWQQRPDGSWTEAGHGDGVQAAALRRLLPWLVMTEESALGSTAVVARFVLACRLTAAALDRTVGLEALRTAHRALLGSVNDGADRQSYAQRLSLQIMRGELDGAERLIARGAREG